MKQLKDFILESNQNEEYVYAIYFDDNTMYNYYKDENEANKEAEKLNKEAPSNKAKVKKEPLKNFEK